MMIRRGGRLALALLVSIALGFGLLAAVYAIPQQAINAHVLESMQLFDGSDGQREKMNETLVKGYPSTWLDNSSDGFFLQYAVYDGEETLWEKALLNYRYVVKGHTTPDAELTEQLTAGTENLIKAPLSRYWHGYLVVLKPLLLFLSYQDIRMVNMIVQGGLLAWLLCLMCERGLKRYLPALTVAILALTPFVMPLNMHYSVVYLIALLGMIAMLQWPGWIEGKLGSSMLFLLLGIATSYFDMLTYPLLSFGLPAVLWLLLSEKEGGANALRTLIRIGLIWFAGYAGMWAGKWLLVAVFHSPAEAVTALQSFTYRSSAEEYGRMATVLRNVDVLWRKPFKLLALAGAAMAAGVLLRRLCRRERLLASVKPGLALSFLGLAVLPLAWYYILPNTNHVHYFFMHRALSVTVFALLCLATKLLERQEAA